MATSLKLHYPHKPYVITQVWGNPNPAYAEHFHDPSFKRHNGMDANVGANYYGKIVSNFPVYSPVEGFVVDRVQFRPDGGGNELWMISKETVLIDGLECYAYLVICHAEKIFVKAGDEPKLGELLLIADNTGFSTGLHTHWGIYRYAKNGGAFNKIDTNEANGSCDPRPLFTGEFAVDKMDMATSIKSALRYAQWYITGA